MPTKIKISKEMILDAAFEIVRNIRMEKLIWDQVFQGEKRSGHLIILCRKKDGNR